MEISQQKAPTYLNRTINVTHDTKKSSKQVIQNKQTDTKEKD